MIVKIDLDPKVLWELSNQAERKGVSLSHIVSAALESTIKARVKVDSPAAAEPPAPEVATEKETTQYGRIRQLWRLGLCDEDIAVEMRLSTSTIGNIRRDMGLVANRRSARTREAARRAASANLTERITP